MIYRRRWYPIPWPWFGCTVSDLHLHPRRWCRDAPSGPTCGTELRPLWSQINGIRYFFALSNGQWTCQSFDFSQLTKTMFYLTIREFTLNVYFLEFPTKIFEWTWKVNCYCGKGINVPVLVHWLGRKESLWNAPLIEVSSLTYSFLALSLRLFHFFCSWSMLRESAMQASCRTCKISFHAW